MERIIVPIDFSETAKEALQYAAQLAKRWNASVEVVHVHSGTISPDQPISFSPNKGQEEMLSTWMEDFVEEAALPEDVQVAFKVIHGGTERRLIDLSRQDTDLIVMGATGKSNLSRRVFGSVSESVARRAHCPVLLVPRGVHYMPVKQMVLASDFGTVQQQQMDELFRLSDRFQASLHFVHVEMGGVSRYPAVESRLLQFLLRSTANRVPYQMACVKAPTIYEGLNSYIEKYACDWVIMAAGKYSSLWDQIFHRSQTKAMILHARKPLMVFHLGD